MRRLAFLTAWVVVMARCAGAPAPGDAGSNPSDAGPSDAGGTTGVDAGIDGGTADAGTPDAGQPADSGAGTDAGIAGCMGTHALVYDALSDRLPHPATPPHLGDAGSIWLDPVYGTPVLRLTDANTLPGHNVSFQVANEFGHNDWNTDATLFYIENSGSGFMLYQFDPTTMTASRVMSKAQPGTPLALPLSGQGFSRTDPNTMYGIKGYTISSFDFTTQTTTALLDLATVVPPPTDGGRAYVLGVEHGANGLLATSFGGPEQDEMPYMLTLDPATGVHHLLDVQNATLDGVALASGPKGTGVHIFTLDHSGRYLTFDVAGATPGYWVWDTTTQTLVPWANPGLVGWASWIRGGLDTAELSYFSSPLDAGAFVTQDPNDSKARSSASWENAVGGRLAPLITETMRPPGDTSPWAAWDNELIAFRTDGVLDDAGVSTVWRFAHNFNDYDGGVYSDAFYYLYIPRVSQNGWFAIFDSNWMKKLGMDSNGNYRTDAFIAKLPNPCGP